MKINIKYGLLQTGTEIYHLSSSKTSAPPPPLVFELIRPWALWTLSISYYTNGELERLKAAFKQASVAFIHFRHPLGARVHSSTFPSLANV